MAKPIVYGPACSTHARTTRLALEEKGVDDDLPNRRRWWETLRTRESVVRASAGPIPG